jgi:hypothetical protein
LYGTLVLRSFHAGRIHYLVLALFTLALLGHACVVDAADHGVHPGHHDEMDADHSHGAHGGACHALPTATAVVAPAVEGLAAAVSIDEERAVAVRAVVLGRPQPAPPLFLLHASLLI